MYSNIVAWSHYLFLWVAMVSGFCCRGESFGLFFTQSAALVPILVASTVVQYSIRYDFVFFCTAVLPCPELLFRLVFSDTEDL